jgi:hypothetical protein
MTTRDFATTTKKTDTLHLYANGTTGDDTDDGLTLATAVATLERLFELIPDVIRHPIICHLEGSFDLAGKDIYLNKHFGSHSEPTYGQFFLTFDGGDDKTVTEGPNAATSGSTTSLTDTGIGWTPDDHMGFFVEIQSGAAAGDIRMIRKNTSDTLYPTNAFSGAVAATDQYRIFRYTTTITAGASAGYLSLLATGPEFSYYQMHLQRLHFAGANLFTILQNNVLSICGCTFHGAKFGASNNRALWIGYGGGINPADGSPDFTFHGGLGVRADFTVPRFTQMSIARLAVYGNVLLQNGFIVNTLLYDGSRVVGSVRVEQIQGYGLAYGGALIQPEIVNAAGVGLTIEDCNGVTIHDIDINNCGSHAIEVINSRLEFFGTAQVAVGTGNVGAGLYAHRGSKITIPNGNPPTITGTIGDISTDGTTEATAWSDIDGGQPFIDLSETTMIEEV